jgi:hypothetical protein
MKDEWKEKQCSLIHHFEQGGKFMDENEEQGEDQNPTAELSPSEKLEDVTPTGSLIPGAENPESKEIKDEVNPNTE